MAEKHLPDPPSTTTTTTIPRSEADAVAPHLVDRAYRAGVLGAVDVLIKVTATRMILLIAVLGVIALALNSIGNPDPWRLAAVAIYALFVVGPLVWLASR